MFGDSFDHEHRSRDQEKDEWSDTRHDTGIDRFEWLLRRNILKGIEEGEDKEGVEVNHD